MLLSPPAHPWHWAWPAASRRCGRRRRSRPPRSPSSASPSPPRRCSARPEGARAPQTPAEKKNGNQFTQVPVLFPDGIWTWLQVCVLKVLQPHPAPCLSIVFPFCCKRDGQKLVALCPSIHRSAAERGRNQCIVSRKKRRRSVHHFRLPCHTRSRCLP